MHLGIFAFLVPVKARTRPYRRSNQPPGVALKNRRRKINSLSMVDAVRNPKRVHSRGRKVTEIRVGSRAPHELMAFHPFDHFRRRGVTYLINIYWVRSVRELFGWGWSCQR
jgi:hypothetical protein